MEEKKNNRYFQHDFDANEDEKIMEMIMYFRYNQDLQNPSLLPYAALGVFWTIVQYLHKGKTIAKDKLHIFADEWRIEQNFLKCILEKFELFKEKDNCYYSERVNRNIQDMAEKSSFAKELAQKRWQAKKQTDKEKEALKQAKKELTEAANLEIDTQLSNYDDYRVLDEINRLKAIEFFRANKNSITKTINFIKEMKE